MTAHDADSLAVKMVPGAVRVARSVAARWGVPWLADELEAGAMLWVVEAARAYDPARDTVPEIYVRWAVSLKAMNFLRAERRRPVVPLPGPRFLAIDPPDVGSDLRYHEAVACLGPKARLMTHLVCVLGLDPAQAGRAIGMNGTPAHRAWRRTVKLLAARCCA